MQLNRRSFLGGLATFLTGGLAAKSTEPQKIEDVLELADIKDRTTHCISEYEIFCSNSDHINWGKHECGANNFKVGNSDSNVNTAYKGRVAGLGPIYPRVEGTPIPFDEIPRRSR